MNMNTLGSPLGKNGRSNSKDDIRRPLKEKSDDDVASDHDMESNRSDSPIHSNIRGDGMMAKANGSTVSGVFRIGVLLFLCMQNTSHALLTRYSQGILKEKYSATEVVFVGEVIKLIFSGYFAFKSDDSELNIGNGWRKLIWLIAHSQSVVVLVVLYSIANVMSYYALGKVEASVYTVLNQLKILTTAAFSMLLLGKSITHTKWRALVLLIIGCILVASPTFNKAIDCTLNPDGSSKTIKLDTAESVMGIAAVVTMCVISGYSAVYFEGMLKKTDVKLGIWHRNFQLAFYSVIFLYLVILWEFFNSSSGRGDAFHPTLFQGWTTNAVIITLIQSGGGLLVAASLKFADAILKTLATSGSIFLSALLGKLFLNGQLDIFVTLGGLTTIVAIFNYSFDNAL